MTRRCFDRLGLGAMVLAVVSPGVTLGQVPRGGSSALVPARFGRNVQDALGFQ